MLQLRQLDLDLALVALGALGEDVQDQAGAIEHARLQHALKVALLGGRQCVVEDDEFELEVGHGIGDFLRLAGTDEKSGIRTGAAAGDGDRRFRASGFCQ
jgi:hypothetical protein